MRLIDADRFRRFAHEQLDEYNVYSVDEIFEMIDEQPTVEAKHVVYGEWKRVGSGSLYDTYECTNCHRQPKWDCLGDNHWRIAFTDICPYCGAIMNGADMRGAIND